MLTRLQLTYLSCFWESLFFGIHCVVIAVVLWLWSSRKSAARVHWLLYLSLVIMYALGAVHLTVALSTWIHPTGIGKSLKASQAEHILALFQFMFGDFVIMWRAWVVWNRNYFVIVVPFCISCSAFGIAFFTVKEGSAFQNVSPSLLVANFLVCTGLIIGRILYVSMQSHGSDNAIKTIKKSPYRGIVLLLAESGVVYTAFQITSLVLYKLKSPILTVFLNLMVPLMGLLPSMIVVLAALDVLPGSKIATRNPSADLESVRFESNPNSDTVGKSTRSGTTIRHTDSDLDMELEKQTWKEASSSRQQISSVGASL